MLDRYADINGPPAALQSVSVDDSTTALSSATTTLSSPSNLAAVVASASRSSQTVTLTATFGTGVANFTHKRIVVHNVVAGSVTGTSATVQFGHDQQSITKDSTMSITYTVALAVS